MSERGKELYKLRGEKIERSFADSKQNCEYRYAMYKGIEKNQNYTWLSCCAQNMKNIVSKLTKNRKHSGDTLPYGKEFIKKIKNCLHLLDAYITKKYNYNCLQKL